MYLVGAMIKRSKYIAILISQDRSGILRSDRVLEHSTDIQSESWHSVCGTVIW